MARRRVRCPDHRGSTAGDCDRAVPSILQTPKHAELQEAPYVEAVGCRVETDVNGEPFVVQTTRQARVGHLNDELAEFQVF